MTLAFLCKRRYMRKDVILDAYARLYELPTGLAKIGHRLICFSLSYQAASQGLLIDKAALRWYAYPVLGWRWLWVGWRVLRTQPPNVFIGASDALHIILTAWLARRLRKPYVIDLYDNFESFGMTRIPGVRYFYRRALRHADVISCVSAPLAAYVADVCQPRGRLLVLESCIDPEVFKPLPASECRAALGLPPTAQCIGLAGALDYQRGTEDLYAAYAALAAQRENLWLVLAGSTDAASPVPQGDRVIYLGELPHRQIPSFWSALDVAVICIKDTPFGRYSFPQKAYEILACQTPLVAAAVGAMNTVLASEPQCLYPPGDVSALTAKLAAQLDTPRRPTVEIPTWAQQTRRLSDEIAQLKGTDQP